MKRETFEDDQLDAMLREHLAATLDSQLGRSRRAFEAHIAGPRKPSRRSTNKRAWTAIGVLTGGLAASLLAAAWALPIHKPASPVPIAASTNVLPTSSSPAPAEAAYRFRKVGQVLSCRTQDEGLIVIDDHTPARIVRQVEMERTQWFDEGRGVRIETITPREDVKLIHLETY